MPRSHLLGRMPSGGVHEQILATNGYLVLVRGPEHRRQLKRNRHPSDLQHMPASPFRGTYCCTAANGTRIMHTQKHSKAHTNKHSKADGPKTARKRRHTDNHTYTQTNTHTYTHTHSLSLLGQYLSCKILGLSIARPRLPSSPEGELENPTVTTEVAR